MYLKKIVCLDTVCGACLGFGFRIFAVGVGVFCGREGGIISPPGICLFGYLVSLFYFILLVFFKKI